MNQPMLKYILALLLFGSNGIVASFISMNSYEIVLFRTFIGSFFLIGFYLITHGHFSFYRHKKSFLFLALSGISMGISWLFLYEAYRRIGVSIASLGYYCGPVLVMACAPVLFKEKITKRKFFCFLVVLAGILLVNSNALNEAHNFIGIVCALMSAVLYACMVSFNKKATKICGMENAVLQLTIAFLSVLVYVLIREGLHFHIRSGDIAPLLFLGLVNTGMGCFLYFSSIDSLKVQSVAILGYLEPASAVFFSFLFLHEQLLPVQAAGAVLMIAGALCAQLQPRA